jgi:hypothetical protein
MIKMIANEKRDPKIANIGHHARLTDWPVVR